jgi:NTP pyrophosphatase (non-canonical NTP hydrolase)
VGEDRYIGLLADLRKYRDERDWQQFHVPKDLAIAITTEAAELLEHFLWRDGDELDRHLAKHRPEILSEIADIAIYLLYLCDALGEDILEVADRKRRSNLERHPVPVARGRARL